MSRSNENRKAVERTLARGPVAADPFAELRALKAREREIAERFKLLQEEQRRRKWASDPVAWVEERLGEIVWSKQEEILRSVRDNRLTAVQSCHGSGKSRIASRAATWWIDTHPLGDAFVVSSAPTWRQVRAILWREMSRAHAVGKLPGRMNQTEWLITMPAGNEEQVAFGHKPQDLDPTAFQGIHCMTEDHQILTRRGWLGVDEINEKDLVLSVPVNGETAEWMPVTKVHRHAYNGPIHTYDSRTVSFAITPEHRLPVKNQHRDKEWQLLPVDNPWSSFFLRRSCSWTGVPLVVPPPFAKYGLSPLQFAKLLGFWTGDGGVRQHTVTKRFYEVMFYQYKGDLSVVESLLDGLPYRRDKDGFRFCDKDCATWLIDNVGRYSSARVVPRIILESPPDVLHAYLDGFWLADGTNQRGYRRAAYTTSRALADGIQEMQVKLGSPASIGTNRKVDGVVRGCAVSAGKHDCLTVGWDSSPAAHLVKRNNIRVVNHTGRVWCISTPYETFFTRRNGRVMLSGNSRFVLVIFDEATGITKPLWEAADSLLSNADSHMLVIGNPDDPLSHMAEMCKPGSGWNVIKISAFDTPNFTGEPVPEEVAARLVSPEWVDEKKRRWGESNPLYISKVLGEWPPYSQDSLIPMHWVRAAQERWDKHDLPNDKTINVLGVDVGGGSDKNIIAQRHGRKVKVLLDNREPDTIKTADTVARYIMSTGASVANVDYIGIGRGAVDYLKGKGAPVNGINVGEQLPTDSAYFNLRAEGYWHLRQLFQNEDIDIDPSDEDLAAQLLDIQYDSASGRILLESKESLRRRGKNSPDKADAVMLACLERQKVATKTKATWGRR